MIALSRDISKLTITAIISAVFALGISPLIMDHGPILLLMLPFAMCFLMFMVIQPQKTLALILLTRATIDPLTAISRGGGGQEMGVGAVLNLLIILLTGVLWIQNSRKLRNLGFLNSWYIFLFFSFCAVFYSPTVFPAFRHYLNYITYVSMAVLPILIVKEQKEIFYWLKILLLSSIVPIITGCLQLVTSHGYDTGDRIMGTLPHPNVFAFYLTLMLVVSFYLLASPAALLTPFWKKIMQFYVALILLMLVLTQTRNAWIACWFIFLIYGLKADRKYLFIVLSLPLLALFIPSFQQRILDLFQHNDTDTIFNLNSFAWRRRLWEDSFVWVAKKPFFGFGLTSFVYFSPEFSQVTFNANMGAHNVYVETLFEMGAVGLLSFIGIFWSTLRIFWARIFLIKKGMRFDRLDVLVLGYIVSVMVMCFGDNMSYYLEFNWYSWFFIGLMIAGTRLPAGSKI